MADRKKLTHETKVAVLTGAGYRCAVPTCRTILAIDLHHMVEVAEDGPDEVGNLLALCPTCHALFHRGEISRDSIYTWKSVLVSLGQAFDFRAVDQLLFLQITETDPIKVSGDGVLQFSRLVAAGLVTYRSAGYIPTMSVNEAMEWQPTAPSQYTLELTPRGSAILRAWVSGDRLSLARVLEGKA